MPNRKRQLVVTAWIVTLVAVIIWARVSVESSDVAAAPQLKPERDWLEDLVDQPPEKTPWRELEARVIRMMNTGEWRGVGYRLDLMLEAKARKQGWEAPPNRFSESRANRLGVQVADVATTLAQWKWYELYKGHPPRPIPSTREFWNTGKGE